MKKYLLLIFILVILFLSYELVVYQFGWYVSRYGEDEVQAAVKTEGKQLYVNKDAFTVKGVQVSAALPDHQLSDYAVTKADYLRWMEAIHNLGANTLSVSTLMDDDFYDALYAFNHEYESDPLYLLQGIRVSDYGNNTPFDAYHSEFYDVLKQDAHSAVDILHGRKNILLNRGRGLGYYRSDVSPWVLGIQLGDYWNSATVAYTNHHHDTQYQGTYFQTTEDATAFEAMLASLMDDIIQYESKKYGMQTIVCFNNDPSNDPFVYSDYYAGQLSKYVQIDATHIQPTAALKSGMIASYHVYEFNDTFADFLSDETKERLAEPLAKLDASHYMNGYVDLLNAYYDIPVLISDYGFSSARGTDHAEPLNEHEQGDALIDTYQDFLDSGCIGAVINHWQDEWGLRSWNTNYALDVNELNHWNDIQSIDHGYGLMAFDSAPEQKILLDGKAQEWDEDDLLLTKDDITLSMRQNEQGIYFMIQGTGWNEHDRFILPIDLTEESGSMVWQEGDMTFSQPVDFIIDLCEDQGQLLVQRRYESLRANYQAMISGEDPYIEPPEKDDPSFVLIATILSKDKIRENKADALPIYSEVYETGRLIPGSNDPQDANFNSLSDYCIGEDGIELRIPWQLLNFANPARLKIHHDYYEHYGVESKAISSLDVGIGWKEQRNIDLVKASLSTWKELKPQERLKKSYEIVRHYWRELP